MVGSLLVLLSLGGAPQFPQNERVSSNLVPTGHFLKPVGQSLSLPSRPVDIAIHPSGKWLYAKEDRGLTVVETSSFKVVQALTAPGGSSYTGVVISRDGKRVWFSNAASTIHEGGIADNGKVEWTRKLDLPKPKIGGETYPTGMVQSRDGQSLYVCASRSNQVYRVDLSSGKVVKQIDTDIAPFDLALGKDGRRLYVSCWGGKRPSAGIKTAPSSGTQVEIDDRGIAKGGSLAIHNLDSNEYLSVKTGLQPSEVVVTDDGRAFVANANHDTITEISADLKKSTSFAVKPDHNLAFGSAPNALALDGDRLYAACGGNNAVAVISISGQPKVEGFLPTAWYPAAVAISNGRLYIANAKGNGSRRPLKDGSFGVYEFTGTIQRVGLDALDNLATYTATVNKLNATPNILKANEAETAAKARKKAPVPVPARLGDPSPIQHVVYVIKENRTYDQVFGDIKKGSGDPKLCIFGKDITPNQHALAEKFVLLDNYYCNGVNSADGHAWSVEGNATSHFERSFGGWTRSYPFGDDPLSVSSTGFLWDNVLRYGKTFRNYGEFNYSEPEPKSSSWKQIYDDWKSGENKIKFNHNIGVERLRRYSKSNYPGWNMKIPDVLRAKIFVEDVKQFNKAGYFPNLTILYLPQDHTSGTTPGEPTPRATVADNDLALGQCVEALSKSQFWKKMAIFVIEDDPQNGFDHIDGHRSTCLVISPYTQTGKVVSRFYNQTSVLHTMQRIIGIPPLNQLDARSPLMSACFVNKPNLTPFTALANRIPLDELNPSRSTLSGAALKWADISAKLPRVKPDMMDLKEADLFNRALWFSVNKSKRYPVEWAGAHGKGLKRRGLSKEGSGDDDDD